MDSNFDYKKAKEEAERMLEVIERDPQASGWADHLQSLVPLFYNLSIASSSIAISTQALKEAGIFDA